MRSKLLVPFSIIATYVVISSIWGKVNISNPVLAQEADTVQVDTFSNSFSYQGRLSNANGPINGICDFQFQLWAQAAGTSDGQIGTAQTITAVPIVNGQFTVTLNKNKEFDNNTIHGAFYDGVRWLEMAVRCPSGTGNYVTLNPRQEILAVPYAIYAKSSGNSGYGSNWKGGGSTGLTIENLAQTNFGGTGLLSKVTAQLYAQPTPSFDTTYAGIHGVVEGYAPLARVVGVLGEDLTDGGVGVQGDSKHIGVMGRSTDPISGYGVYGSVNGNQCSPAPSDPCTSNASGIYGTTEVIDAVGVRGYSKNGSGVEGISDTSAAGSFIGRVDIYGNLYVNGSISKSSGSFKIDHPLDPANKYLYHSFVESPDMMNIYNGNSSLDDQGEAWVDLPAWFEALNKEFRYQLTAIGSPSPNLYIAQEIQNNRFKIAGGQPSAKVSWQVTGIRHDRYAEANRIPVEEDKPINERGTYLHPGEWDQSKSLGVNYSHEEELRRHLTSIFPGSESAAKETGQ